MDRENQIQIDYARLIGPLCDCLQFMADRGESPKSDFLSILGSWNDSHSTEVDNSEELIRDLVAWHQFRSGRTDNQQPPEQPREIEPFSADEITVPGVLDQYDFACQDDSIDNYGREVESIIRLYESALAPKSTEPMDLADSIGDALAEEAGVNLTPETVAIIRRIVQAALATSKAALTELAKKTNAHWCSGHKRIYSWPRSLCSCCTHGSVDLIDYGGGVEELQMALATSKAEGI